MTKVPHELRQAGFSLVETLVALLLLSFGLLAVATLFFQALRQNAVSADAGTAAAAAASQLERLRLLDYDSAEMAPGGSLTADTSAGGIDYFDASSPDVHVRWRITANATPPGTKVVAIRAISQRLVSGQPKEATVVSLRGE